MTESVNRVTTAPPEDSERMQRVLDAAAELLVRQGYRRVTIEDVARRAGVGKGTVYLHVRGKDALMLTVLLRAQRRMFAALADRMLVEPEAALPWRMSRLIHEMLRADEVLRAFHLGDTEVLGRLADEAAATLGDLGARREEMLRATFGVLRGAGLVDDGLTVEEQLHSWGAVLYGFLLIADVPQPDGLDPGADRRAELVEYSVRRLLAGPAPEAGVADVATTVAGLYRPLIDSIDAEWRRRIR